MDKTELIAEAKRLGIPVILLKVDNSIELLNTECIDQDIRVLMEQCSPKKWPLCLLNKFMFIEEE